MDNIASNVKNNHLDMVESSVNYQQLTAIKKAQRLQKKLMHYMGKAIADYNMINTGDRILVCLSGGKDSFTMLDLLNSLKNKTNNKFEILSFTLDQAQPGWQDAKLRQWLENKKIPYKILTKDTYTIVKEKTPENKTYCSLCSRLRRGIIYQYAKEHGFNKISLGHHRDDLIQTLLMSIMYNGQIKSMPPKLLTDDKKHIVIRPMAYCQEKDILAYQKLQNYPLIPCNLCGSQINLTRVKIKKLINSLAEENPKIPSNILNAIGNVQPSQLMDHNLWNFKKLAIIDEDLI